MTIAGRTFRALIEEVLSFQFSVGKYEPLVKTWLNDAQRKAVLESELRTQMGRATYATEAGDGTLELPSDYAHTIDFADTDLPGLLDKLKLRELDTYPESSGRPAAYAVAGKTVNLYPTPDGLHNLALRYWKLPQDMVADSDVPEIPAQYHELLVGYPMWKAYLRENDYAVASTWKGEWEAAILKMRGEVNTDTADGPSQVEGSWGNEDALPYTTWR